MDRIIRITLCLFMILFVSFSGIVSYQVFVEHAYLASLDSTYSYSCTITTSSTLSNVTLFIPVPADTRGNSLIVERFSIRNIEGLPDDWTATLFDTGKATMVRIMTPLIAPPQKTTRENPYSIRMSSELKSGTLIDTREPIANSALFRPITDVREVSCPPESSGLNGTPRCYQYLTSLYAEYRASADAEVTITSSVTGKNQWKIFEPRSNEYTSRITLQLAGENRGWEKVNGFLRNSTGNYDAPVITA